MAKASVYDVITDRVVAALEAGSCPWRKPWTAAGAPRNISGREYRGINVFVLRAASFSSPYWLTFRQALALGGNVRKGQRGTPVVFWRWLDEKDAQGVPTGDKVPLLRYYTVFNLEQCDNVPAPAGVEVPAVFDPIAAAEAFVASVPATSARIREGASLAAYNPTLDEILMPARTTFTQPAEFYSTLFHELTHSTGHASRLARPGIVNPIAFGSHEYSREELVAEMGAAFLCGESGILPATIENSAAYLRSWIKVLKGDSRLVVFAAAQAQKAADWLRGGSFVAAPVAEGVDAQASAEPVAELAAA